MTSSSLCENGSDGWDVQALGFRIYLQFPVSPIALFCLLGAILHPFCSIQGVLSLFRGWWPAYCRLGWTLRNAQATGVSSKGYSNQQYTIITYGSKPQFFFAWLQPAVVCFQGFSGVPGYLSFDLTKYKKDSHTIQRLSWIHGSPLLACSIL